MGPKFKVGWTTDFPNQAARNFVSYIGVVTPRDTLIDFKRVVIMQIVWKYWSIDFERTSFVAWPVAEVEDKFTGNITSAARNLDVAWIVSSDIFLVSRSRQFDTEGGLPLVSRGDRQKFINW